MRTNNIFKFLAAGAFVVGLASCESSDIEYPDYSEQTVYFAYQTPIRTMVMGMDDLGSTADNDSKACKIYSTMGGAYNGKDIKVEVAVDNSLCDNLYYDLACTDPVLAMPSSYYQLSGSSIDYKGELSGSIDVQLTDAFFNDPKSYEAKYVIPVVMKNQTGATRILSGEYNPGVTAGSRFDGDAWFVAPKDYVLYCVRYISKYEGYYLPKGHEVTNAVDLAKLQDVSLNDADLAWEYISNDKAIFLDTKGLNTVVLPVKAYTSKTEGSETLTRTYTTEAILTFSGETCTVSCSGTGTWEHEEIVGGEKVTKTEQVNVTLTGNGTYTEKAEKYAWGTDPATKKPKLRDGLKLDFEATWNCAEVTKFKADYDMALQRRGSGNTVETFSVTLKK